MESKERKNNLTSIQRVNEGKKQSEEVLRTVYKKRASCSPGNNAFLGSHPAAPSAHPSPLTDYPVFSVSQPGHDGLPWTLGRGSHGAGAL